MSLEEDIYVADYQARFLTLERFTPSSFASKRESAAQFVLGLLISIYTISVMFSCSTLAEVVMRALECEHAQQLHHQARGIGKSSCQG